MNPEDARHHREAVMAERLEWVETEDDELFAVDLSLYEH